MTEGSVKRGDIFYADLSPVVGSEQGGTRPVLIVQNDTGNRHSPTVIAAAITSQTGKARLPTHINITGRHWIFGWGKTNCLSGRKFFTTVAAFCQWMSGNLPFCSNGKNSCIGYFE